MSGGRPARGAGEAGAPTLRLRRLGIDTHQEPVLYLRADCPVCRSEGFEAHSRVLVRANGRRVVATLNIVRSGLLGHEEAGLSEAAWRLLGAEEGDVGRFTHAPPLDSFRHVRGKIHGVRFSERALERIVGDIVAGRYADVHLAALVSACAGQRLSHEEMAGLTRAMVAAGERMTWERSPIADKHCVGGLPGNRTTMIVVPICAAWGLVMPKTSSRAITSPAGTADAMETVAPVDLSLAAMRSVVEAESGCIVWGGAVHLSPADDTIVRVERALDIDSEGLLVASVLSKKAAVGSTHVLLDLPVGPTAKVRTEAAARHLGEALEVVGEAVGLSVRVVTTDGTQPIGRGIGPALEARDVLAVLRGRPDAPADLRARALDLAGALLAFVAGLGEEEARREAEAILADGRAWTKFQAICEAQGGMREPPRARHTRAVQAPVPGVVRRIDNRGIARVAKLAGAPSAWAAGVDLHVRLGAAVQRGQPLFTIHAEAPGELAYALEFLGGRGPPVLVGEPEGGDPGGRGAAEGEATDDGGEA